jgi:hypothetical protein
MGSVNDEYISSWPNLERRFTPLFLLDCEEGVRKMKYSPLTLPYPAKGEGKRIEIQKKFPPP